MDHNAQQRHSKLCYGAASYAMQIDLIDMGHQLDGIYKWIAHYIDHWSEYHIHFPMVHKSAVEIAHDLKTRVLAYFGVPRVLQSDCGCEFNNHLITTIVKDWPGKAVIVHGRP